MFGAALFWIAGILFELPRDRNKNFQKVLTFGLLQDIERMLCHTQSSLSLSGFRTRKGDFFKFCIGIYCLFTGEIIMGQTDLQFKNDLRKELILFKEMLKLLDDKRLDELREKLTDNIDRINASLQD